MEKRGRRPKVDGKLIGTIYVYGTGETVSARMVGKDIIVEGSNMQDALSKLGEALDNESLNDMMKFQEGK
jgi:hypothetical protein